MEDLGKLFFLKYSSKMESAVTSENRNQLIITCNHPGGFNAEKENPKTAFQIKWIILDFMIGGINRRRRG